MNEDTNIPLNPPPPLSSALPSAGTQTVTLSLNMADVEVFYANFARISENLEEMVIDFGFLSGATSQQGPEAIQIKQRIIMNYANAKRLLVGLNSAIARHEQLFGVIEMDAQKRVRNRT